MPRPTRGLPSLLGLAALALAHLLPLRGADAKLVRPAIPPRGMNSFDIQFARRDPNTTVPVWNESEFRRLATAMASQLLPAGFDTIVIDGGWAGDTIDGHGRPTPDVRMWCVQPRRSPHPLPCPGPGPTRPPLPRSRCTALAGTRA